MASAASLNATATIVNGHGLAPNPTILAEISTYRSQPSIALYANVYTNANADPTVAATILPVLGTIGSGNPGYSWLFDVYPPNVTPTSSASVAWTTKLTVPVGTLITQGGTLYQTIGSVYDPTTFANVANCVTTPHFSTVLSAQVNYPFNNGISGFASGFSMCLGTASQAFDTIGSLSMLNGKTYGQSGIGYTGITDLLTGGIGSEANLLGAIVTGWGTMYDVTNINLIADPYVFGQNLLNQGLGKYGNLAEKLTAVGLNINDITQAPLTGSVTYPTSSSLSYTSLIGPITLPTVANTTVTTTATGNNPNVITAIYSTITGSDLAAIISATGFTATNNNLITLADYLDFIKVVGVTAANQLNQYNVKTFKDFSTYLNSRIGQQQFNSWADVSSYLASISVPVLPHTTTTANTAVLNPGTASTLSSLLGTGSGPFGNPVMSDYLGSVAGIPYNTCLSTINSTYSSVAGTVSTAMQGLDQAVLDTYTKYYATATTTTDGGGNIIITYGTPDATYVTSNVAKVNAALATIPASQQTLCQTAYYTMLNRLTFEVTNLARAGVGFTSYGSNSLLGFGQSIGGYGSADTSGLGANQIIGNLITNDSYGDTIRAVIAEQINSQATTNNDPNPRQALSNANTQGIPLTTYLSQNK